MRGRIGNTVYRKGQKGTVASQYQPQVSNPKTLGQAAQRAVFASVSQAAAALRSIINHSHYGLLSKRDNEQRFVQQNLALVKGAVLGNIVGNVPFDGVLNLKGVKGIQPMPYRISEGTLAFQSVSALDNQWATLPLVEELLANDFDVTTQAEYETALRRIGINPGEQLSVVALYDTAGITGSFESNAEGMVYNRAYNVLASRVTFVEQIPEGFSGYLIETTDTPNVYRWNPALIARSEGAMLISQLNSNALLFGDARQGNDDALAASCVVRSAKDINGRYNYSTTSMVCRIPTGGWPRAIAYVESYMAGASVELGERPFLNNPLLAATNATGSATISVTATTPLVVTSEETEALVLGLSELPASLILSVRKNGATPEEMITTDSADVMQLQAEAVVAQAGNSTLTLGSVPSVSGEYTSVTLNCSGAPLIVLGGYGTLADGTSFTF